MGANEMRNLYKDRLFERLGVREVESTGAVLGRVLGFVVLGAIVGAGVSLLLAPKSGRELREDLASRLRTGRNEGSDLEEIPLGT